MWEHNTTCSLFSETGFVISLFMLFFSTHLLPFPTLNEESCHAPFTKHCYLLCPKIH